MSTRCKHGSYVGGCGIDWMCHACEMGYPDPTIDETIRRIVDTIEVRQEWQTTCREIGIEFDPFSSIVYPTTRRLHLLVAELAEIRQWATSDTDDDWMARRHRHELELEREMDETITALHHYTETDEVHEYGYVPD